MIVLKISIYAEGGKNEKENHRLCFGLRNPFQRIRMFYSGR